MAFSTNTQTFNTVIASSLPIYEKGNTDNIFKEIPLIGALLEKNKKTKSGLNIQDQVEYAKNNSVAARAGTAEVPLSQQEIVEKIIGEWSTYSGQIMLTDDDKSDNSGEGKILDMFETQLKNLRRTFKDTINTDLHATSWTAGSNKVYPLGYYIPVTTTTGTTLNLSRVSPNTWWRNQSTATAGPFSLNGRKQWRTMYNLCAKGQNFDVPDLIITDKTTYEYAAAQLDARERITMQETTVNMGGPENFTYKKAKVVWDDAATAGYAYFINTNYFYTIFETGREWRISPEMRPNNKLLSNWLMDARFNIICTCLARQGVISGITE